MPYLDREDAGRRLSANLARFALADPVVLGIGRGGGMVAARVASSLGVALDVAAVSRIAAPSRTDVGVGAVDADGTVFVDTALCAVLNVTAAELRDSCMSARRTAAMRANRLEAFRREVPVAGRTVILVDDGAATGASARVAARRLRQRGAFRIIFAVPVASAEALGALSGEVDEIVCLESPRSFRSVADAYLNFRPIFDDDVVSALLGAVRGSARQLVPQAA